VENWPKISTAEVKSDHSEFLDLLKQNEGSLSKKLVENISPDRMNKLDAEVFNRFGISAQELSFIEDEKADELYTAIRDYLSVDAEKKKEEAGRVARLIKVTLG